MTPAGDTRGPAHPGVGTLGRGGRAPSPRNCLQKHAMASASGAGVSLGALPLAQPLRKGPGVIHAGRHGTGQGLGEHERGGGPESPPDGAGRPVALLPHQAADLTPPSPAAQPPGIPACG